MNTTSQALWRGVMGRHIGAVVAIWTVCLTSLSQAQSPSLSPGFETFNSGPVYSIVLQPDGRVLVAGDFGVRRYYPDGTLDKVLTTAVDGPVFTLAVQADGKIVAGGDFATIAGQPRAGLARFNSDGTLDATFTPAVGGGSYAFVNSLAIQADGRILVGGGFDTLVGVARANLGRLNTNGTLDTTFTATANGFVNAVVIQADGKIVVGGDFSVLAGQSRAQIGRLAATGAIDTTFNPGIASGFGQPLVFWLAVQADGKILVGGAFDTLGGQSRDNLGRLNSNGTVDTFNPGADGPVWAFAVQTDGKILVAGDFSTLAGQSRSLLGRLDSAGGFDAGFTPQVSGGSFPSVFALAVQPDGQVCFGGVFTTVNSTTRMGLARLSASIPATQSLNYVGTTISWLRGGSGPEVLTTSFDHATNGGAWTVLGTGTRLSNGWQRLSATIPAGRTLRARGFSAGAAGNQWYVESYLGKPVILKPPTNVTNNYNAVAKFDVAAGGTEPLSYQWLRNGVPLSNQGNISGATNPVLLLNAISSTNNGSYTVVVSNVSGSVTSTVATLTVNDPFITQNPASAVRSPGGTVTFNSAATGTPPLSYQWYRDAVALPGATNSSVTLSNLTGADAGLYTMVAINLGGSAASLPAGLTVNGVNADNSFNPTANSTIYALAVQRDGKILVGGNFTNLSGQARSRIGRLNADGTVDLTFNVEANSTVRAIALQTNGSILVGGNFTSLAGITRNRLGRLSASGVLDASFNPNVSSFIDLFNQTTVSALAVQADGKIIVGGLFSEIGVAARHHIGRMSIAGVVDTFNPGPSYESNVEQVNCVVAQPDGKVLAGGAFAQFGGQARTNLARVTSAGALDAAFNPRVGGQVYALALQADGKILVGGVFTSVAGQAYTNLARLNTDGTVDVAFNPGANGAVYTLAVQTDGKILLGGAFTTIGGQSRGRLARLNADGSLDLAFNPGAGNTVYAVTVQSDGKVLVGGVFATLASQSHPGIGRLESSSPATQILGYAGTTITWLRGGSGPEVWRTSFDHSADGTNWTVFGAGTRIAGGWQRTAATLPAGRTLRAVGQVSGGYCDGSGWFVESYYGRPVVIAQPQNRTNGGTTTATFQVVAGGSQPMTFQWQKGGVSLLDQGNISGATSNRLTLVNVLKADEGAYRVIINNSFGSATSMVANLTVLNPIVLTNPVGAVQNLGGGVTFNVGAVGSPPLSYQWYRNGELLPGAIGSSLQLQNLARADAGYYTVVVTNFDGSVTSSPALLTVNVVTAESAFSPQPNASVSAMTVEPDGKVLIAGQFSRSGVEEILWRYDVNRTLIAAVPDDNPGYFYTYDALAALPDGKTLIAGFFPTLGGTPHSCIGRFLTNLTVDATFNANAATPAGLDDEPQIEGMAVQADGKILVGGYFTTLVGAARNNLGRLNTNGTLDTFNPGADYLVNTFAIQGDGRILAGGQFSTLGGAVRSGIGRLNTNGTLDATFNPGVDQAVSALAVQADGKVLVGGYFTTIGGQPLRYLARLNTNGTVDLSFNPSASGRVSSIAAQSDGKILVGGNFTSMGGQPRNYIARLNADGTLDPVFNPGASATVHGLGLQADGKIMVGGNFSTIAGASRSFFALLNNPDPATESLTHTSTNLVWLRGGASPEVWRTTFERSTNNGVSWTSLGAGTRVSGGWRVNVTNLPASGLLRTRGHVAGGFQNASSWFVESIFDLTPKLQLSLVRSNAFVILSWTGAPGPYQVEQTADLSNPNSWQNLGGPVQSNSMTLPIGSGNQFLRVRVQ